MRSTLLALLTILSLSAWAQEITFKGVTPLIDGGTNNVAASSTATYTGLRIDCPRATEFALYVSARPRANASNIVTLALTLYPSVDGSTVANAAPSQTYTLTGTTNSSGLVIGITNVTTGSIPYYFLTSAANAEGLAATNLTVSYGPKLGR